MADHLSTRSSSAEIASESDDLENSKSDLIEYLCDFLGISANNPRHNWIEDPDSTLWNLRTPRKDGPMLPVDDEDNKGELISFDLLIQSFDEMSDAHGIATWSHETKLMLAVILSHSLLHLCATDKLQKNWPRNAIYFLQVNGATMTRPLFRTSTGFSGQELPEDSSHVHLFPTLVGFAIMLLEIYECERIQSMVRKKTIVTNFRDDYNRLRSAFMGKRNSITSLAFRTVIDFCIKPSLDLDMSSSILEFQEQIYDKVVKLFEQELENSHGAVEQLDALDLRACELKLESGTSFRTRTNRGLRRQTPVVAENAVHHYTDIPNIQLYRHDGLELPESPVTLNRSGTHMVPVTDKQKASPAEKGYSIRFKAPISDVTPAQEASDEWVANFSGVITWLQENTPAERADKKIKITILDTGVNLSQSTIEHHRNRIVRVCDFTGDLTGSDEGDESGDQVGHGTCIACMVLEWAPLAEVSIGKVSDRMTNLDDGVVHSIAKGVQAACSKDMWDADIIVLSLGFDEEKPEIDKELRTAYNNDIIVFAAASNDGPIRSRTYPAWEPHVFGIHSMTGYGKWSDSNPDPEEDTFNFAILGEEIDGSWCSQTIAIPTPRLFGSSYSNAIAAALAASVLSWSQSIEALQDTSIRIKSHKGMALVFKLMSEKKAGMSLIYPWKLFDGDFTYSSRKIARKLNRKRRFS